MVSLGQSEVYLDYMITHLFRLFPAIAKASLRATAADQIAFEPFLDHKFIVLVAQTLERMFQI
jgi:hypothetical protein